MANVTCAARRAFTVLACIAFAAMAHVALSAGASGLLWAGILAAPVIASVFWLAAGTHNRALWLPAAAVLIAIVYALERWGGLGFAAAYGVPHAAAYSLLLCYFGGSLRDGREPLITRLARRIRGTLSPERERYTRRLTVVWCFFSAGQLACSAALLAFAPLETWSFFVNVLNAPLVAAMFAGDYAYRLARLGDQPVASIARIWRAFVEDAASSSARSR
jgi:uncharacterized membrane protein